MSFVASGHLYFSPQAWETKFMRFSTIALVGLLGFLMAPSPVHAQYEVVPSHVPAVFKAQLLQFIQLTRRNIRDIQALPPDDSAPVDLAVIHNAHLAYAQIRAAQWGMGTALGNQTYKDPMLDLAHKKAVEAFNLSRFAASSQSGSRPEYISRSVQDLSKALRLAQQALIVLP